MVSCGGPLWDNNVTHGRPASPAHVLEEDIIVALTE